MEEVAEAVALDPEEAEGVEEVEAEAEVARHLPHWCQTSSRIPDRQDQSSHHRRYLFRRNIEI